MCGTLPNYTLPNHPNIPQENLYIYSDNETTMTMKIFMGVFFSMKSMTLCVCNPIPWQKWSSSYPPQ